MALVTTKRNVDVLPGQAAPTVFHCSQHDVGATVILGLVNAGGNYSIPSGVTAIIQGSCSNGTVFTPVTATVSGSDITFNLSAEMTSIAGPTVCEAVLSKDTDVLGTANFILDVEPSAMGSDTPPVFTDAAWLWMVNKMGSETVSALGDKTVINAINEKADQSDVTALSDAKLDKNQGTANAGKYLKVGTDGNVAAEDLDVTTDKTLSIADKAADAKAVGDELTDLKADLQSITETHTETETTTTQPEFTKNNGYWWNGAQSSGSYTYAILNVQEGDVIQCIVTSSGYIQQLRFVDAYNNSTRVTSASKQSINSYTVPSGVNKLYVSVNLTTTVYHFNLTRTTTTTFALPIGVGNLNNAVGRLTKNGFVLSDSTDTLASGTEFILAENIDNKKNDAIDVWARFESLDTITVGHGTGTYGGYITVDATYAKVYYNGTLRKTYTHGLTITDFVSIHVKHYDEANAHFVIETVGGNWKSTESALWHGCRGKILVKATMDLADVRLSTTFTDFKKDCIIFGDSYVSMGDSARWPYYAIKTYGASNLALVGFGGANSANQIVCFRNILQLVKPTWVGWFLGMNDADTASAVNTLWKECADEVIETCNSYGVIPVLATIPCTPTQRNDYKNSYVRNSGCAYVDFAKAVNGEEVGAQWYSGMLSSDNVHPTASGAKALAARLIADMPQLI